MSSLGHVPTFVTPLRHVGKAAITRHSAPNVGNAAMGGPTLGRGGASAMCQEATFVGACDVQNQATGWLRKGCSSLGGVTKVRFPRIWMSSGERRFMCYIALLPNDNLQRNEWKP